MKASYDSRCVTEKRIAHILPKVSKAGGAERVAVELANHAARSGHIVSLIAGWHLDPELELHELDPRIEVHFLSKRGSSFFSRYFSIVPWLIRNRKWLSELDILHCHLTFGSVLATLATAMFWILGGRRPAVVETYHTVGMAIPRFNRWVHSRLATTRDALALMAEDEYWRSLIDSHQKLLSRVIPNGIQVRSREDIDNRKVRTFRRNLGIPDDRRFVVGTVGMLRPARRPLLHVPVFSQLAKEFEDDIEFVIAGGGSEFEKLKAFIAEYHLQDKVHLPGLVSNPHIVMSALDLYVTVNVENTTGLAAMQAAGLGVPIVAIQFQPGYQAKDDDWIWSSTSLSEVAHRAIAILRSDKERRLISLRQAEHVRKRHSIESMSQAYDCLYNAAIGARNAKASSSIAT